MPNRREMIQGGAALVASSSVPSFAKSTPGALFHRVIYDERFPTCRTFAGHAKKMGAEICGIRGNVTELWYGDISRRWKQYPVAIAGLTTCSPLFGLEVVASDYGMALAFRGDHRTLPTGAVHHRYFGPRTFLNSHARSHDPELDWATNAADLIMKWPAAKDAAFASPTNIAMARLRACEPDTLVSWIIAPARRPIVNQT